MLTVRIQEIDGTGTCTLLDSQPCRLLTSLHPISETSSLLQVVPPLVSASVLSPSWFFHLRLLRSHRSPRFPRSARSPLAQAQATLMPDAASVRKQAPPKLVPR